MNCSIKNKEFVKLKQGFIDRFLLLSPQVSSFPDWFSDNPDWLSYDKGRLFAPPVGLFAPPVRLSAPPVRLSVSSI